MHPNQFTLINSPDPGVVERSGKELDYHTEVLDRMELGPSAKVQIHMGGVYGGWEVAIKRFASAFARLG